MGVRVEESWTRCGGVDGRAEEDAAAFEELVGVLGRSAEGTRLSDKGAPPAFARDGVGEAGTEG